MEIIAAPPLNARWYKIASGRFCCAFFSDFFSRIFSGEGLLAHTAFDSWLLLVALTRGSYSWLLLVALKGYVLRNMSEGVFFRARLATSPFIDGGLIYI